MLDQLKHFQIDRLMLDEMLALSAFGKSLRSEYETRTLPAPEWLSDQLRTLEREILARRRDELEKRLKETRQQLTGLETTAEKRERLQKEQEEIERQLSDTTVSA